MTIKVSKPSINLREALSDLKQDTGLKGQELMRAETVAEARNLIGAGRKNLIINGGFDVWQRGTSTTSTGYRTADRWQLNIDGGSGTVVQSTDVPSAKGFRYCLKNTKVSGGILMRYAIEGSKYLLRNNSFTISFWAKSDNNSNITIDFNDGQSSTFTTTASWTKYSRVFTNVSDHAHLGADNDFFDFSCGNADTYKITGVQLEVGSVATDFEHRSYGEELALCQRYYEKITWAICPNLDAGNTNRNYIPAHSVWMRGTPTVTLSAPGTGNSNETYEFSSGQARTITHVSTAVKFPTISPYFQLSTGANRAQYVTATFSAEL